MTPRQSWPFEEKFIPPDWNERVSRQLPWRWAAILEIKTHECSLQDPVRASRELRLRRFRGRGNRDSGRID
jgi:hypothetical protein